MVHHSMKQHSVTISHLKTAVEIWQTFLPSNHPRLIMCHHDLVEMYWFVKDYVEAFRHAQKALQAPAHIQTPSRPSTQLLEDELD